MMPLIRATIKRHLKWYFVPFIYFLVTSLLCAYAWYIRPIPYRSGIKAVFKTIALNPTLILTALITVWIIIAIISIPILFWLKKRFPEMVSNIANKTSLMSFPESRKLTGENKERFRTIPKNGGQASRNDRTSPWAKLLNVSISVLGVVFIVAGLSIALWVARPYITFLFSTSKIETLEKKAELLGQVQEDAIKKSEESEKRAELPRQIRGDETKERRVLEEISDPPEQVQVDEIKKNLTVEATTTVPEQVQKNVTKKSGVLEQIVELMQKDVTKKSEALEKTASLFERVRRDSIRKATETQNRNEATEKSLEGIAEVHGQVKGNRMIIPTALVDAEILDGVNTENLALGVCRVLKSAKPGQKGNCIIEGHNLGDYKWWRPQGPFNMIEVLEKGVNIYISYKGKKYTYKVKEKHYKDVNDPNLYDFSPGERLTLITCTSSWNTSINTDKRTVIVAYPQ
jgi:LPXTG-site transpeptidase (sortase) family protein